MSDEKTTADAKALKTEKLKSISLPSAALALDVMPDGRTFFVGCLGGEVFVGDSEAGKCDLLARHDSYVSGVVLLTGGKTLVSSGYDGVLQWHDLSERKTVRKVKA